MADEKSHDDRPAARQDHQPPPGAETTATWGAGATAITYTASAKWFVLRKKDKLAAEIFSVSYVARDGDLDRPVTFVFNGGPGASSACLHLGAVGPMRVAFPADGTLPTMPPRPATLSRIDGTRRGRFSALSVSAGRLGYALGDAGVPHLLAGAHARLGRRRHRLGPHSGAAAAILGRPAVPGGDPSGPV